MELVLDASVILKWFFDEELSEKALQYRRQHLDGKALLVAPSLLIFEFVNALCTKPDVKLEAVLAAIDVLFLTGIRQHLPTEQLVKVGARLSKEHKISAYDAAYIALAQNLGCQFITADRNLYQKVKSLKFVKLLGGGKGK